MQPTHRRGYPSCHRCRQTVGSPKEPRPAPLTLHPGYYDASGDCANRHTRQVSTEDGTKVFDQPKDAWIEVPIPPLIDQETWDMVQILKKQRLMRSTRNTKVFYLLQHLLRCSECGLHFVGGLFGTIAAPAAVSLIRPILGATTSAPGCTRCGYAAGSDPTSGLSRWRSWCGARSAASFRTPT